VTHPEREALFDRYENGPKLLRAAWAKTPVEARRWPPSPGKWSAHQIIVHCADSETNSAMRIRYLAGETAPVIAGYDQARWAAEFDYHGLPVDLSFTQIESVRAWTAAFIRALPDEAWSRAGRHTEYADPYTAETWLSVYAEHLEIHARQLDRNLVAWNGARG
jgi:hypothetical protein